MKLLIPTIIVLLFSTNANASDLWVDMHVMSKHSSPTYTRDGETRAYNEVNPGIGLTKELNKTWSGKAGVYKNSYYKTSFYLGYGARQTLYQKMLFKIDVELVIGMVSGYDKNSESGIIPMALPGFSFTLGDVKAHIGYIPPVGDGDSVATFSVGFRI